VVNVSTDHYDPDVSLTPRSESARYKIRLMDAVITRIQETAARFVIPLILLIIPSQIDLSDDYDSARVDSNEFPEYRHSALTDVIQDIAERHRIPFVNLYPKFQDRDAHRLYFYGGNNHWNDMGQDLAAEITTAAVVSLDTFREHR
jgi:SGNH hydrolase-like domain, acetyltransferase AlgX